MRIRGLLTLCLSLAAVCAPALAARADDGPDEFAEEVLERLDTALDEDRAEQVLEAVHDVDMVYAQVSDKLRKKLDKSFYEIGELLAEVQVKELHLAKGYSTFESFLDREVDLPRTISQRIIRIAHTFQRETAYDFGLDRLTTALAALDGEVMTAPPSHKSSRGWSSATLPPKPPIRFDD